MTNNLANTRCHMVFFVLGLLGISQTNCEGQCDTFIFPPPSGKVHSPGFPKVEKKYECRRNLNFPDGDGLIFLKFEDIQLYYTDDGDKKICSITLDIGNYTAPCTSAKEECIVYFNSDNCNGAAAALLKVCKVFRTSRKEVEIVLSSFSGRNWYIIGSHYPTGFQLDYKFVHCPSATTGSNTTEAVVTKPTPTFAGRGRISRKTTGPGRATVNEDDGGTTVEDRGEINGKKHDKAIIIAVCSVLIVLLLVAIVIVLILRRRRQMKPSPQSLENEYQECTPEVSAEIIYSAAYDGAGPNDQMGLPEHDTYYTIREEPQAVAPYSVLNFDGIPQSENLNSTYSAITSDSTPGQSGREETHQKKLETLQAYSTIELVTPSQSAEVSQPEAQLQYNVLNLQLKTNHSDQLNQVTGRSVNKSESEQLDEIDDYSTLNFNRTEISSLNQRQEKPLTVDVNEYSSLSRERNELQHSNKTRVPPEEINAHPALNRNLSANPLETGGVQEVNDYSVLSRDAPSSQLNNGRNNVRLSDESVYSTVMTEDDENARGTPKRKFTVRYHAHQMHDKSHGRN